MVLLRWLLPQPHPSPYVYTAAIADGEAVPQSRTGARALPLVQTVMVVGSAAPKSRAAVSQCAGGSAQQFHLQREQLILQSETYLRALNTPQRTRLTFLMDQQV